MPLRLNEVGREPLMEKVRREAEARRSVAGRIYPLGRHNRVQTFEVLNLLCTIERRAAERTRVRTLAPPAPF